ncbi:hypothetical protein HaLaN_01854, partial [Haematococcus lacustris]
TNLPLLARGRGIDTRKGPEIFGVIDLSGGQANARNEGSRTITWLVTQLVPTGLENELLVPIVTYYAKKNRWCPPSSGVGAGVE